MDNLFFDLDGTLTDPFQGITNCIQFALEAMGHVVPEKEALRWCIGPPLTQCFTQLLPEGDEENTRVAVTKYRERYRTVGLFENEVIPGIEPLLIKLHRQGRRLFVATSKPHVYATQIIEYFGYTPYFEAVHGSELDGLRTNKSDLLAHILFQHDLDPKCTVMIGDREYDVYGAKAHNIQTVGVLWGFGSREELIHAGADRIAENPEVLSTILNAEK